jgi:hypothetical protein
MEADWEIEIGGGAAVIEALWEGFVDLRAQPDRIAEIAEARSFLPLATLLRTLNSSSSSWWTAKCDLWQPDAEVDGAVAQRACYIDLLPCAGLVFAHWEEARELCRQWAGMLESAASSPGQAELVVRQAVAGEAEGFGVTAYLSASGTSPDQAAENLAVLFAVFASVVVPAPDPAADPDAGCAAVRTLGDC